MTTFHEQTMGLAARRALTRKGYPTGGTGFRWQPTADGGLVAFTPPNYPTGGDRRIVVTREELESAIEYDETEKD